MKAFVINEDQIKKVALLLVCVVIFAFLAGYFTGSKNLFSSEMPAQIMKNNLQPEVVTEVINEKTKLEVAPSNKLIENKESQEKLLQKKKEAEKKEAAKKKAAKIEADKKAAAKKKAAKIEADKKAAAKKKAAKIEADKKAVAKKKAAKVEAEKKAAAKIEAEKNNKNKIEADVNQVKKSLVTTEIKPGDSVERVYSIQAGMFASEDNANSFIEKLSAKQFDAYVSDFVSTSGAKKYNVRVGRFAEREQARELLKEFQKSFSSPAYVVIAR